MRTRAPDAELEALLLESEDDAAVRAAGAFDAQAGTVSHRLVLFGAGNLGRIVLARLRELGIPPLCFSDNDATKWGTIVDGLPVLAPADAASLYGTSAVAVMSIWGSLRQKKFSETAGALRAVGFERVVHCGFLFWKHAAAFLPYYAMDLPQRVLAARDHVRRAFSVWGDDASRWEYVAQVRWRLSLDFDGLPPAVAHDVYFAPDLFTLRADERFVDCGAYDGDTLRVFFRLTGGACGAIAAWEPDSISRARLEHWIATLPASVRTRITVSRDATGAEPGDVLFTSSGTPASAVGRGGERIRVVSLDDATAAFAPTFIKMDIEGAELDTLKGARNVIATNRPILAVCTYHLQSDLWQIPLELARNERYTFALRPHLPEVWELVSYAVPNERLHG